MADGLEVTEGVPDEVHRRALLQKLGASVLGQDDGHGVEQDRGASRQLAVSRQDGPVRQFRPADLGRDDEDGAAVAFHRLADSRDDRAVGAVGDQDRDLAALQAVRILADDPEGRRGFEVDGRSGRSGRLGQRQAHGPRHAFGQILVDIAEIGQDARPDMVQSHLRQFKDEGAGQMGLFDLRLRAEEEPGLAVVVGETLGAQPALLALHRHGGGAEAAFRVLARPALLSRLGQTVRLVVGAPLEDLGLHMAVALEVLEGTALGLVDRDLMEVDGPQPRQLGVLIGEEPPLQQGVLREVDARHDVGGQEGRLLGLGEEVVGVSVQHHAADDPQRMILFRDQLGRIENIERQGVRLGLVQQLDGELPFREVALIDGLEQIAPMIVRVGPGDLDRLVPAGGLGPQPGTPVELDEGRLPLGVDQPEGVDAEALDHAQRSRNGPVGHGPHHHMGALGHQADEVPERVMRAGRLRIAAVGLHLHGMDQVGEFDRVLDEEDGDVVADQIPVALGRIEFDGKAPDVARRIH